MTESQSIVVLITAPSAEKAAELGRAIVEERLAACANIVPGVRSIYRWEGKVCDDAEVLMVVKTQQALFDRLEARVKGLHPYDCPEIIALPIVRGHAPYLQWIADSVER